MWIEKVAKTEQEKIRLFNEFFWEFEFSKTREFEKVGNRYKVVNKSHTVYFSDFDVEMDGEIVVSSADLFANTWGKTIASKLNGEERMRYIQEFFTAEKPYVKHLQELIDNANNF